MKLQDLHPYDSFIVGINKIYYIDYKGNFHINAPFILAANKTVSTGSTYILIYSPKCKNKKVHLVGLLDAYYHDGTINLIVQDILSQETFTIDQQIECTGDQCKWILIDFDFFFEDMNTKIIKSYCKKCDTNKQKPSAAINPRKLNEDLLDFEFKYQINVQVLIFKGSLSGYIVPLIQLLNI